MTPTKVVLPVQKSPENNKSPVLECKKKSPMLISPKQDSYRSIVFLSPAKSPTKSALRDASGKNSQKSVKFINQSPSFDMRATSPQKETSMLKPPSEAATSESPLKLANKLEQIVGSNQTTQATLTVVPNYCRETSSSQ